MLKPPDCLTEVELTDVASATNIHMCHHEAMGRAAASALVARGPSAIEPLHIGPDRQVDKQEIVNHYAGVLIAALPDWRRGTGGALPECLGRALNFCITSHSNQWRRYGGLPAAHHPVEVACELLRLMPAAHMSWVIAALLHDVIEDTAVTAEEIQRNFGEDVMALVVGLTKVKATPELSPVSRKPFLDKGSQRKRERNRRDWIRLSGCSAAVQTIKCVDRALNVTNMAYFDLRRHKRYEQESRYLLATLTKADDRARRFLQEAIRVTTINPVSARPYVGRVTMPRHAGRR